MIPGQIKDFGPTSLIYFQSIAWVFLKSARVYVCVCGCVCVCVCVRERERERERGERERERKKQMQRYIHPFT